MPEKWRNSARFSAFFDIGNVFSTGDVKFVGKDGVTPVDYDFAFDKLQVFRRASPSSGWPRWASSGSATPSRSTQFEAARTSIYGDETEGFQFSIGQAF